MEKAIFIAILLFLLLGLFVTQCSKVDKNIETNVNDITGSTLIKSEAGKTVTEALTKSEAGKTVTEALTKVVEGEAKETSGKTKDAAPVDSEWLDKNGIKYKQANRFEACSNIDKLIKAGSEMTIAQADQTLSRVKFLEVLLKAHCIDHKDAKTDSLSFTDISGQDENSKQIIQKSIEIGIANGSEVEGKKVFNPNDIITKIEALAILRKLSKLELKDNTLKNNYTDIDVSWKKTVANTSDILGLLPMNDDKSLFNPNELVTNKMFSTIVSNAAKYYR